MTRTGEAKVEVPKASPAVTAEFLGTWEGAIQPGLRVVLTISNGKDGGSSAGEPRSGQWPDSGEWGRPEGYEA